MPYFEVTLHGHGIDVPLDGETQSIGGFYTSRVVKGPDIDAARKIAVAVLAAEWRAEPLSFKNRGSTLEIDVDAISEVSVLRGLLSRRKGFAFYPRVEQ